MRLPCWGWRSDWPPAVSIGLGHVMWGLALVLVSRLLERARRRRRSRHPQNRFRRLSRYRRRFCLLRRRSAWVRRVDACGERPAGGSFLVTSFYINGASFLGYAILAEKHGHQTSARGIKSLFFSGGLLEGTETIALFVLICALPGLFPVLAWCFGALTLGDHAWPHHQRLAHLWRRSIFRRYGHWFADSKTRPLTDPAFVLISSGQKLRLTPDRVRKQDPR